MAVKSTEGASISPQALRPGMVVRIHQKIKELNAKGEEKERIQIFEGMILSVRGNQETGTFTVRKISDGVGVERIFPFLMPGIAKIELVREHKVRRAKLYYLKNYQKKMKEVKK
jgi:large subunit ribosomal protein L19